MIPAKYEEVKVQMDSLLYTVEYDSELFSPYIAYTIQTKKNTLGKINRLYINNRDPELTPFLFMHEAGHILFAHTRCLKSRFDAFLLEKLKAAFNQVKILFDDDLGHFTGCFTDTLFNVVMDFEVNSRLFSEEEWEFMQAHTRTLLQNDTIGGQWPLDYGFPLGKTWNEYLNMVLLNIKDFINYFRIESKIKQMRRDEGFDGVISESTYQKIKKEFKGKKFSLTELHDFERLSHAHSSEYAIPHGSMSGCTRGAFLEPTKVCFINYTNMKDLLGKVKKLLIVKGRAPLLRNQLYNTNRRRYSTNVIIPKTVKYNTTKRPNLYLLFDISGSVDAKMVHDFFLTFQTIKQEFTYTKIVFWADHFNGECTLEDKIPDYYGGGTDIASGITYINKKYELRKKDVFFVISDFCDNLEDWAVALKKMECKLYAIDWNSKKPKINPGFEKILMNSPVSHSA